MSIKKISYKTISFIILICTFFILFPQMTKADDEVVFECPNLEEAMVDIIGHVDITIADMKMLDGVLDLSYKNISNISGLEHLTNTEDLILSYNNIADITPIVNLNSLESLYINDNWIKTLPDTTSLNSLQHLDISNNEIKSIPNRLFDMPVLYRLYMKNLALSSIPDFSFVADTLDRLDISSNRFDSFEFISTLTNLELLIINDCELSNIPDLSKMTNLGYLYFSNNNIMNLPEYLGYLPLIRLDFSNNLASSMPDSFINLTKLEQLVLTDNYFRTLPEVITKLYNLEVLMCGQNIISDVSYNISDLKNIKRASFASNELTSLYNFQDFTIPYSYQISFDLNYIDLNEDINAQILEDYHNTGGIQKTEKFNATIISADTDSVVIECFLDNDLAVSLGDNIKYKELKLFSVKDRDLILVNTVDLRGNKEIKLQIKDSSVAEEKMSYIVCIVLEDTSWPPKFIKLTKEILDVQIASVKPNATQTLSPTETSVPISTATAIKTTDSKQNYLLYILLLGVIMIIIAGTIHIIDKKRNQQK